MKNIFFILLFIFMPVIAFAVPIQLHPENPRYFLYKGQPTILITSGEHYGAVLNLDFDYRTYLQTLAKDGLNLTRLFSGAYVEKAGAFGIKHNTLAPASNRYLPPWKRSDAPGYAGGGNKFDLDTWNPAYFERLKDFMRTADQHGVVVELVFFSSTYTIENWNWHPFNPANNINGIQFQNWKQLNTLNNGKILPYQEALVRKLVTELNGFDNLYFEIQNEPWADQPDSAGVLLNQLSPDEVRGFWENRIDLANRAALAWQKHLAAIVRATESDLPKKHLLAQNYCNFQWPLADIDPKIDIFNFHYASPNAVLWNWAWERPVSYDESGFSGHTAEDYRPLVWRFMLSGGAVFSGLDYSFYPGHEDGTGINQAPGVYDPEFRRQLGLLKHFFEQVDFIRMQPDRQSVKHAPNCMVYMISNPGKAYAAYLEGRGPSFLKLELPAGNYRLEWFVPKTGAVIAQELIQHEGGLKEIKVPDFERDLVLKIEVE